jgi:hypothetical protein
MPRAKTSIPPDVLSVTQLEACSQDWLLDCEIRNHTDATLDNRRFYLDKLLWFLKEKGYADCGDSEMRAFFAYLKNSHKEKGGRWDNPKLTQAYRPSTIKTYHIHLSAFLTGFMEHDAIALDFLLAGGNETTLQQMLGLTTSRMLLHCTETAQADPKDQREPYSPVDRLDESAGRRRNHVDKLMDDGGSLMIEQRNSFGDILSAGIAQPIRPSQNVK